MVKKMEKAKEFIYNGDLKFEGEYKNGERNGKFKHYYISGELEFKGNYLDGKNKWRINKL